MRTKLSLAILMTLSLLMACNNDDNDVDNEILSIDGVALNYSSLELTIGDTTTLNATILPLNLPPQDINWDEKSRNNIYWKSDKPNVATVTQDGIVEARGKGSCNISFICGTYAADCSVLVRFFENTEIYGQWLSDDSLSCFIFYDGTGTFQNENMNWTFDGMRLTINTGSIVRTFVITATSPGRIVYYDMDDPDKRIMNMQLVAREITMDDLSNGIIQVDGKDNAKFDAVDLGLPSGMLWSTCNLMAQSPQESGHFYAWGETGTKDNFTLDNYKWYDSENLDITKYSTTDITMIITLLKEDDAANAYMGGEWRIPTDIETQELCDNCEKVWSKLNGVDGLHFISRVKGYEGNSIFLPYAGLSVDYYSTIDLNRSKVGLYWTSSLSSADYFSAYCFYISMINDNNHYSLYHHNTEIKRANGACIRPVIKK